ncbi:MAG: flagellin [Armatimonadota bacterium]
MSLTSINQNIASLNAQRNLSLNSTRLQSSVERLSSGLRINRGADDPSGLITSETLRAQISSLDVAGQNALEGVNLIKTAEGALNESNALLKQMRNLAVSAASESNNSDQSRAALQERLTSALTTLDSIANTTTYGGRKLLDGSAGTKTTVADSAHLASASLSLAGQSAGWANVHVTAAAAKATVASAAGTVTTAATTFGADMTNFDAGDEVAMYVNGSKVNITSNGQNGNIGDATTWQDIVDGITTQQNDLGVTATATAGGAFSVSSLSYGSDQHVSVEFRKVADSGGDMDINEALSGAGEDLFAANAGANAEGHVHFDGGAAQNFTDGSGLTLSSATYGSVTLTAAGNAPGSWDSSAYVEDGKLSFQIGINAGETAEMGIRNCQTSELGKGVDGTYTSLAALDLSTVDGASAALAVIDASIGEVSQLRGDLGAFQTNELESQARSLAVTRENLSASESAIRDTDFGKEMSEFTTSQIMVQAATSFLTQANGLPNQVLSLIRG